MSIEEFHKGTKF